MPQPLPNTAANFWDRVARTSDDDACWPWQGKPTTSGYGKLSWSGRIEGAHRIAWHLATGLPLPVGNAWHVCHACHTPLCCNPAHLRLDTREGNRQDMLDANRQVRLIGSANGRTKVDDQRLRDILARSSCFLDEVATEYGIDAKYLRTILNGARRN